MTDTYPFGWTYVAVNVGAWLVAPVLLYMAARFVGRCRRRSLAYRAHRAHRQENTR